MQESGALSDIDFALRWTIWVWRPFMLAWIIPALLAILGAYAFARGLRWRVRVAAWRCGRCGYAIAVSSSRHANEPRAATRCPECANPDARDCTTWRFRSRPWIRMAYGLALLAPFCVQAGRHLSRAEVATLWVTLLAALLVCVTWATIGAVRHMRSRGRGQTLFLLVVAAIGASPFPWIGYRVARWLDVRSHVEAVRARGLRNCGFDCDSPIADVVSNLLPRQLRPLLQADRVAVHVWRPNEWALLAQIRGHPISTFTNFEFNLATSAEIRTLTNLDRLRSADVGTVRYSDDLIESLRELPARVVMRGIVVDDARRPIGEIRDDSESLADIRWFASDTKDRVN